MALPTLISGARHGARTAGQSKLARRTSSRNTSLMTTHAMDRRRNRSPDPLVALHYQLVQTRQEGRLEAVVVADDSGVVVAGAGGWAACEELAAYAPLLARGAWSEPGLKNPSRMAEMRAHIDVQQVDIEGQTVLLCARGPARRIDVLDSAAAGVARILTRAA